MKSVWYILEMHQEWKVKIPFSQESFWAFVSGLFYKSCSEILHFQNKS